MNGDPEAKKTMREYLHRYPELLHMSESPEIVNKGLEEEVIGQLIESMPRRVEAGLRQRGWYTK